MEPVGQRKGLFLEFFMNGKHLRCFPISSYGGGEGEGGIGRSVIRLSQVGGGGRGILASL